MKRLLLAVAVAIAVSSIVPVTINSEAAACPRHNPRC